MVVIAPSILSADFMRLGEEIRALERAGADHIHVDVMDGHFVPNLTLGPPIVKAIRKVTSLPLDVHLMIETPDRYLDQYIEAGADFLTLHVEACTHLERALKHIKAQGKKAGVALNPSTHERALEYVINDVDLILVMSVNPGFSGQQFIASAVHKIRQIRAMLEQANNAGCLLSVDGGINELTAKSCVNAGATSLVAGSFVFSTGDYAAAIKSLRA